MISRSLNSDRKQRSARRITRLGWWFWIAGALVLAWTTPVTAQPDGDDHGHSYEHVPVWGRGLEDLKILPDGQERIDAELHRQGKYAERWREIHELLGASHVSHKGQALLERRGLGRALLRKTPGAPVADKSGEPDRLRVLIVRISFEENRLPNLTTIPADGDFMLDPLEEPGPIEVDPPPHDRAYFQAHLQGLSEYYQYQSGGRLIIEGDVLPHDPHGSYKLGDIADYGPGEGRSWGDGYLDDLERLVHDMIAVTDSTTQANGTVNLAEYDDDNDFTYVIFVHSGSDWQSDVNGDSPNDIPTFFITLGEPVELLGTDPETQTRGLLGEVSVIPETTNQDGYPGSIAAALYHEFGHALGLVDVYNTEYGTPNAGIWDLMDSGTNLPVTLGDISDTGDTTIVTAVGVLPPSLGVWNKWFLGWLEMGEVDGRSGSYYLPPVWVPREQYGNYGLNTSWPQALRAGISPREFFLLENRWVPDLTTEEVPFNQVFFSRDPDTQVILFLGGEWGGTEGNTGMYDYFLPPGGVLVWHVNQDRIEAGLADNTINTEWDGLRLVEADGIEDIGVLDSFVLGWYGTSNDPFAEHNGFQNLYVDGYPNSRAFDRSWTGLQLSDVRQNGLRSAKTMRFEATIHHGVPGFPWEAAPIDSVEAESTDGFEGPRGIDPTSLTVASINGSDVLVFADQAPDTLTGQGLPAYDHFPTALYALRTDGHPALPLLADRPVGAFLTLEAPLAGPPTFTMPEGGPSLLQFGTKQGMAHSFYLLYGAAPVERWSTSAGDTLLHALLPLTVNEGQFGWLAATEGVLRILADSDGSPLPESYNYTDVVFDPAFAGPNELVCAPQILSFGDGSDQIAAITQAGWLRIRPGLNTISDVHPFARFPLEAPVYAAVLPDGDDLQLHVFDARGDVGAWELGPDGSVREMEDRLDFSDPLVTAPAVADVDGDGRHDLVLATATRISAFGPSGTGAVGYPLALRDLFPLADSTRVRGPLIVADATGDGVGEVFFQTSGGHLFGIAPGGRLLPETPLRWADRKDAGFVVGSSAVEGERALWMATPGGYTGPPLDRGYVNGRIMGFDLGPAAPPNERSSEWLGLYGGSARSGVVGTPQGIEVAGLQQPEQTGAYFYPNPLRDDTVTLRFYGQGTGQGLFTLHTLEGEEVTRREFQVDEGIVNELEISLPRIASGMYIGRLLAPSGSGTETTTLTLAVER